METSTGKKSEGAPESSHLGRRAVLGLLMVGAIGGMIGLKMFRNVGFRKREVAAAAPQKRIVLKTNPDAVSRMKKDKYVHG